MMRRLLPLCFLAFIGLLLCIHAQTDKIRIYLPLVLRPEPTSTPSSVYVLPNHSWYRVDLKSVVDWPHIVGEIQNNSSAIIYNVRVPVAILDSHDQEIGTDIGATRGAYLTSGRKTCFECILDEEPQDWTTYKLGTVTYAESSGPWYDLFHITSSQMIYNDWGVQGYEIAGEARGGVYPCPPHCYMPSIVATFYDVNGKVAGCRHGYAWTTGGSHTHFKFKIKLKRNWEEGITYELYIEPVLIP